MRSPRAFIFDLDGTLVDTNRLNCEAWRFVSAPRGYDFTEDLYLQIVGRPRAYSEEHLKRHFGRDFPFEQLLSERRFRTTERCRTAGVPLKPGALDLVRGLYFSGFPLAVATSTPHGEACEILSKAGLFDFFLAVVGGDEVQAGKPDPEIFLECAKRLATPPDYCAVFEDSELGVLGADAAGMLSLLIPDMCPVSEASTQSAYVVLKSLTEAKPFFRAAWGIELRLH